MSRELAPALAHAAFRSSIDPIAARRQRRAAIGVTLVLVAAIGLCASAVSPRSGWIEPAASALSRNGLIVNAWLTGSISERS